jgi:hypothetical protein
MSYLLEAVSTRLVMHMSSSGQGQAPSANAIAEEAPIAVSELAGVRPPAMGAVVPTVEQFLPNGLGQEVRVIVGKP